MKYKFHAYYYDNYDINLSAGYGGKVAVEAVETVPAVEALQSAAVDVSMTPEIEAMVKATSSNTIKDSPSEERKKKSGIMGFFGKR